VDGVLTDGRLYFTDRGTELKTFSTQDGHALRMLQGTGVEVAIITGRRTRLVARRARELGIRHLFQGADEKRDALTRLLERTAMPAERVAHVGDDVPDLPVLTRVGLAIGVADAAPAVLERVDFVTTAPGGRGAVREICERIMRAQGTWDRALAAYL